MADPTWRTATTTVTPTTVKAAFRTVAGPPRENGRDSPPARSPPPAGPPAATLPRFTPERRSLAPGECTARRIRVPFRHRGATAFVPRPNPRKIAENAIMHPVGVCNFCKPPFRRAILGRIRWLFPTPFLRVV